MNDWEPSLTWRCPKCGMLHLWTPPSITGNRRCCCGYPLPLEPSSKIIVVKGRSVGCRVVLDGVEVEP
jgi:hypothetical protein